MLARPRLVYGRPTYGSPLAPTTMQSSVTQYGITWTFDQEYPVGQYCTGDYFVVGPVTITEIDPPWGPDAWDYYRNGSMVNSTGGGHGLDAYSGGPYGTMGYSASLNIEDSTSGESLPIEIPGVNSVISAIGRIASSSDENIRPRLQGVSVLTVVDTVPRADAFRPSYVGTSKAQYHWSDVEQNLWRLPNLSQVEGTPLVDSFVTGLQRPWFITVAGWSGRYFHPVDNMSNYHREIGRFLSRASVLLMMDVPNRNDLLRHYIQVGIDYYAVSQTMQGTSAQWQWPVIFSGIMLGDDHMRDIYVTGDRASSNQTRTMWQLYRLPGGNLSTVDSSIVPGGADMVTWTGKTAAWSQDIDSSAPNEYFHEHLHPSEWSAAPGNMGTRETYRRINSPAYVGLAAAAAAMGAQDRFYQSDLYFDYAERWMEEDLSDPVHDVFGPDPKYTDDNTEYGSSTYAFIDEFWDTYYSTFL